jgi:hypothetical protein
MATTSHEIAWRHDFDAALREAAGAGPVLLDFSAAPM